MRKATGEKGLTFGPDPATHNHCTIGGMLGNNSCGIHSVMAQNYGYGARTSDNTESLTILTYDGFKMDVGPTSDAELTSIINAGGPKGEIYLKLKQLRDKYQDQIRKRYPNIPRRVSGYNLDELLPEKGFNVARALVGSEGTCVTILSATMKLIPEPQARTLVVLGYPSVYDAGSHVVEIMKFKPIGLEGLDNKLISFMQKKGLHAEDLSMLPKGNGWLLVEFPGANKEESDQNAKAMMKELKIPTSGFKIDGGYDQLLDMIEIVSDRLDGKSRDLFYAKYIRFIWEIVSHLQKRSIERKCDKSRYGSSMITQNDLGWESITINKNTDPFVLTKEMIKEFNRRFNINSEVDTYQKIINK
jgi:FAD/FMN-containing dehydrogenase